ncbi:MAG: DUF6116 family protein [Xanthomonadales bacterium]|nr:DUF6116 family protein [Xanthomonadales bacterium]
MNPVAKILKYAESLRFPWLVLLTGLLFVADVIVPDVIPFVDELLLGLLLAGLSRLRKKPKPALNASGKH